VLEQGEPADIGDQVRPYYLRFRVRDRPGIIAELASILAAAGISVDAVLQEPSDAKDDLPFVITVEPAPRSAVSDAVARMRDLDFLIEAPLALPLEAGLQG
jgi:homoserine dehydrogenase